MSVSFKELVAAISSRQLVICTAGTHWIPYEPHLYGQTADGRDVVVVREAPSGSNWSEPGEWTTKPASAIDWIETKKRFEVAHEIPLEHLAQIREIYAQVKSTSRARHSRTR
jgi:hypothetical protein